MDRTSSSRDVVAQWEHYFKTRGNSLIRLQIANIVFLSGMLLISRSVRDDIAALSSLLYSTLLWMVPSAFCLCFLLCNVLVAKVLTTLTEENAVVTWERVGWFVCSLRGYHLLLVIMGSLGIVDAPVDICRPNEIYGTLLPAIIVAVDVRTWLTLIDLISDFFCMLLHFRRL